jgi:hypothetical protein
MRAPRPLRHLPGRVPSDVAKRFEPGPSSSWRQIGNGAYVRSVDRSWVVGSNGTGVCNGG